MAELLHHIFYFICYHVAIFISVKHLHHHATNNRPPMRNRDPQRENVEILVVMHPMVLQEVTVPGPLVRTFGLVVCRSPPVQEPRVQFPVWPECYNPHKEIVENILAICLPIMTMQHIRDYPSASHAMRRSAWNAHACLKIFVVVIPKGLLVWNWQ